MKILLVSDTHGRDELLKDIVRKEEPIDYMIHCGDIEGTENEIRFMTMAPVLMVRGNNDFYTDLKFDVSLPLEGHKILVTHGHTHGVYGSHETLREQAKAKGHDIVMYGHIHRPIVDDSDPACLVLNPGSLTYPRQNGRQPSYMVVKLEKGKKPEVEVKYVGKKKRGWL